MKTTEEIKQECRELIFKKGHLTHPTDNIRIEAKIEILRWILDGEEVF